MFRQSKAPMGASLVVASSFFYASYGIWTKLMGDYFGGYTASTLRSVLVVLMLLPIALLYRKFEALRFALNGKYIAGMFVGSLFTWGPLYYSIQEVGVGISLTINYASMVIGLFFFGWLIANERLSKDKVLSAILGLGGICLIFLPTISPTSDLGLILAVVSGISIALTIVCAKGLKYSATQSTFVLWVVSVLANLLMIPVARESMPLIAWNAEWMYLVLFAIASIVASWSLIKGLQLIDASAAGILGLLEIVFGVLFGVVFFAERPTTLVLVGALAIVAAAAVPYVKDYRTRRGNTS